MEIINFTHLATERVCLMDRRGAEVAMIIVKGTWTIDANGTLVLADEQLPVNLAPVHWGDPVASSLRYESDVAFLKPATDCVLVGHAYPQRSNNRQVAVGLRIGNLQKVVQVSGDRYWDVARLGAAQATMPQPFERIPLVYERAFGGRDASPEDPAGHDYCRANPVGVGFRARASRLPIGGAPLPNIEEPGDLLRDPDGRPRPAGFGMVSAHWEPRQRYAGTYDAEWQRRLCPLLPEDFDDRFFNAAADGLRAEPHLQGREPVLVQNATPDGQLRFELPDFRPRLTVRIGMESRELPVLLDTVIIEPDTRRVQMVWRGLCDVHLRMHQVEWFRIREDRAA